MTGPRPAAGAGRAASAERTVIIEPLIEPEPLLGADAGGRSYVPDFLTQLFRYPLDAGYLDAAQRRATAGPDRTSRRVLGSTVRILTLVFMGFLLVAAYDQAVAARPSSIREKAGLIQDVQRSQSEATTLQRQADQLQATVTRARDQALAGTGTDIVRLRQLEALTGLGAVTGGGARVSLTDATARTDPVTGQPIANPAGKVTDGDLQVVTNELWRDGAEAIAINGQRLTATSTIRTAGVTILVDFQPVVSPYRIEAIGPSNLDDRFNRSQTGADYRAIAALTGLQLRVDPVGRLTLPAATLGSFSYAYPLTGSPATAGSPVPSSSTGPAAASSSPGSGTPSPSGGR